MLKMCSNYFIHKLFETDPYLFMIVSFHLIKKCVNKLFINSPNTATTVLLCIIYKYIYPSAIFIFYLQYIYHYLQLLHSHWFYYIPIILSGLQFCSIFLNFFSLVRIWFYFKRTITKFFSIN